MKKAIKNCLKICLWSTVIMFILQLIIGMIYSLRNGDKVVNYARFQKVDENGKKSFNFSGLICPWATEDQHFVNDNIKISGRIIYPLAKKFELGASDGLDSHGEDSVGNLITKIAADSLNRRRISRSFDIDGQAIAVRRAMSPSTLEFGEVIIYGSYFGTASPESAKDGLEHSLQPNVFEKENGNLAKERLERSVTTNRNSLAKRHIGTLKVLSQKSAELQLKDTNQVKKVMANMSLLNDMRYVEYNLNVPTKRLVITPITLPVLLPLWVLAFLGLLYVLGLLIGLLQVVKKDKKPVVRKKRDWSWIWKTMAGLGIMIITAGALALFLAWLNLVPEKIIWLIIIICTVLGLIIALSTLSNSSFGFKINPWDWSWFMRFIRWISNLFKKIFNFILKCILIVLCFILAIIVLFLLLLDMLIDMFVTWWKARCTCCQVLMVVLFLRELIDVLQWFKVI